VRRNYRENSYLLALNSLEKNQKNVEGNFFDFDFGFLASSVAKSTPTYFSVPENMYSLPLRGWMSYESLLENSYNIY